MQADVRCFLPLPVLLLVTVCSVTPLNSFFPFPQLVSYSWDAASMSILSPQSYCMCVSLWVHVSLSDWKNSQRLTHVWNTRSHLLTASWPLALESSLTPRLMCCCRLQEAINDVGSEGDGERGQKEEDCHFPAPRIRRKACGSLVVSRSSESVMNLLPHSTTMQHYSVWHFTSLYRTWSRSFWWSPSESARNDHKIAAAEVIGHAVGCEFQTCFYRLQ